MAIRDPACRRGLTAASLRDTLQNHNSPVPPTAGPRFHMNSPPSSTSLIRQYQIDVVHPIAGALETRGFAERGARRIVGAGPRGSDGRGGRADATLGIGREPKGPTAHTIWYVSAS